ncbi:MAG: glycosyltransferase family 39 protein [Patescibacteria group bacterium]|nr:glycosyltransferase family 39 protein [Patescibacteria group bacterium]
MEKKDSGTSSVGSSVLRMLYRHRTGLALIALFALAALLRFPNLTQHDVIDDEALMAFRSIGWLDTWFGSMQTPVDLFDTEQWWQKFSFHDHPPLLFFVEHQFFQMFGPTVFALRLPFAIAGMVSVYLAYLLGREMAGRRFGLLTAAVISVANFAVWLSRAGFQEGILQVWLLLALWFFLRSIKNPTYCLGVGAAMGLALLTKYSSIVLVPVILGGYAVLKPSVLRSVFAAAGAGICLVLFSPVIVYNAMLFFTRGHFDATLWAMLGQQHPDFWSDYHAYSSWSNFLNWWHWMPDGLGLLLLGLAGFGGIVFALGLWRRPLSPVAFAPPARWTILSLVFSVGIFLCLSPGRKQYVALAIVPVALVAALALAYLSRLRYGTVIVSMLLLVLGGITFNTQVLARPVGTAGLSYLPLRPTSYAYQKLDAYLDSVFAGKDPAYATTADKQLKAYLQRRAKERFGVDNPVFRSRPPYVIFDPRMDFAAVRWTMYRRDVYLLQPAMMMEKLTEVARLHGVAYIEQAGFRDFRMIFVEPELLQRYGVADNDRSPAWYMRKKLDAMGEAPETTIADINGTPAFAVYRVSQVSPLLGPWDKAKNAE